MNTNDMSDDGKLGDTRRNADGSTSTLVDNGDGTLGTLTSGLPKITPRFDPFGPIPIPPGTPVPTDGSNQENNVMSTINVESTIFTALRVAPELFERRAQDAQALPLVRDEWTNFARDARETLDQLETGALRIVQGSGAVTEPEREALIVAALREAHNIYLHHAKDDEQPPRIRQQFERQAQEARVVCSRLELGRLHVVQDLHIVRSSEE